MRERLSNQVSVTITADSDGRQRTLTDGASQVGHAAALPARRRVRREARKAAGHLSDLCTDLCTRRGGTY